MNHTEIIAGTLKRCGLFHGLSAASHERLAAMSKAVRCVKGQVLFREGEQCAGIFVVASGAVRVYKLAPNGKEHVLHFAHPGMTFAEVAAIGEFACPANAEATEDSICVLVQQTEFSRLLRSDHDFCIEMLSGMARWVHNLVGLLEDLVLRDATARVARHLLQCDDSQGQAPFHLPMKKRDLASHLNLTSETLSRTLRRLDQCGLIEQREQAIHILHWENLQDVADGLAPAEFS